MNNKLKLQALWYQTNNACEQLNDLCMTHQIVNAVTIGYKDSFFWFDGETYTIKLHQDIQITIGKFKRAKTRHKQLTNLISHLSKK